MQEREESSVLWQEEVVQMWNKRLTGIAVTAALLAVLSAIECSGVPGEHGCEGKFLCGRRSGNFGH